MSFLPGTFFVLAYGTTGNLNGLISSLLYAPMSYL